MAEINSFPSIITKRILHFNLKCRLCSLDCWHLYSSSIWHIAVACKYSNNFYQSGCLLLGLQMGKRPWFNISLIHTKLSVQAIALMKFSRNRGNTSLFSKFRYSYNWVYHADILKIISKYRQVCVFFCQMKFNHTHIAWQ